jgi:hypothetical protein
MVSEELLGSVRKQMSTVRVPAHYDRVYKDECQFSFDTPLSANGLYINFNSWQAFGQEYVEIDSKRSGQQLYLHELWHKVGNCFSGTHSSNLRNGRTGLWTLVVMHKYLHAFTAPSFRCHSQLRRGRSKSKHQKSWQLVGTAASRWMALHIALTSTLSLCFWVPISGCPCPVWTFQRSSSMLLMLFR